MPQTSKARNKAVDYLVEQIKKARISGKYRLPTIAHMAQKAGVGPVVMWKTVKDLKNRHQILSRPGGGITVVPETEAPKLPRQPAESDPAAPITRREQLTARIAKDLLSGVYPPGTMLPNVKELTSAYGIHSRALKKALAPLVEDGRIVPFGRSYRVPPVSSARQGMTLVLIASSDETGNLHNWGPRIYEHYRMLESECVKIHVNLMYVPLKQLIGGFRGRKGRGGGIGQALEAATIAGFMIWSIGMTAQELSDLFIWLSRVAKDKPVSILDETEEEIMPQIGSGSSSNIKFFKMACGKRPGEDVGRFLVNLGHRKIAFVSAVNKAEWSLKRLEGLQNIYAQAGIPDGVHAFTLDNHADLTESLSLTDIYFRKIDRILKEGVKHSGRGDEIVHRTLDAFRDNLISVLQRQAISILLAPLFDRALKEPGITAWVGANDAHALDAMDYLNRNQSAVSGKISVIGFDDCIEASFEKLTSYNFNSQAVIQAMVRHIFDKRLRLRKAGPQVIEIDGYIVERRTTHILRDI